MKDFSLILKQLEDKESSYVQTLGRLQGEQSLLQKQIEDSSVNITRLDHLRTVEIKSTEFLLYIQKQVRTSVVDAFEKTVSFALRAIYGNENYAFKLDFTQRGHLGELWFKIKSPTTNGFLDLKECACGGEHDVVGLALRFVLLHVIQPRMEGFVGFDEPTKQLDEGLRKNEHDFYQRMSEQFQRQLIIITHSDELKALAEYKIPIGKQRGE